MIIKASSAQDFQIRASSFENRSRWVKDDTINSVPFFFLSNRESLGSVLDAGGGTGYLSWFLTSRLPASSVTIVDASENMLRVAEERLPKSNCICSPLESYFNNNVNEYDTILARQILHYVDDVNAVLVILREMLRKGGLIYVGQFVVCDNDSNSWHEELIKNISRNRKRSFILKNFIDLFKNNAFNVLNVKTTPYEENLRDFYTRSTNIVPFTLCVAE